MNVGSYFSRLIDNTSSTINYTVQACRCNYSHRNFKLNSYSNMYKAKFSSHHTLSRSAHGQCDNKHGSNLITESAISTQLHVIVRTLKLYADYSSESQLADNAATTRVVWRWVWGTNNSMFLDTVTSTAADERRRCAAMQKAGSDKRRRARATGRQQVWLQVCFQCRRQWQLINTVYCSACRNCPTAELLQW